MTNIPQAAKAIEAHARGIARAAPRLVNMEQRQSVRYVSELARRVPEREMVALAQATQRREAGLELARRRDCAGARQLLLEAERIVADAAVCDEAQMTARSYHAAAAAFVEHVDGDQEAASASISEALVLCSRLRVQYGYSVEIRRVHLARNFVRLMWSRQSHVDAWTRCGSLLGYVWQHGAAWPLSDETSLELGARETLRPDERMFLTDQILSEAISTAADARRLEVAIALDQWPLTAPLTVTLPVAISAICELGLHAAANDAAVFVDAVARYFEQGRGELPMTWRRLEALFEEISATRLLR